jgi:hypothetical protein
LEIVRVRVMEDPWLRMTQSFWIELPQFQNVYQES